MMFFSHTWSTDQPDFFSLHGHIFQSLPTQTCTWFRPPLTPFLFHLSLTSLCPTRPSHCCLLWWRTPLGDKCSCICKIQYSYHHVVSYTTGKLVAVFPICIWPLCSNVDPSQPLHPPDWFAYHPLPIWLNLTSISLSPTSPACWYSSLFPLIPDGESEP